MNELKTAMLLRGVRAVDLARAAGVTTQQINHHINGGRPIGAKSAHTFGAILRVSEAYLRGDAQRLAVCDFSTGETTPCKIIVEIVLDRYGVFYTVDHPRVGPIAVILADGVQFTTGDWGGAQPPDASVIGQYRWVDAAGRDAVMVDGLPRLFWGYEAAGGRDERGKESM